MTVTLELRSGEQVNMLVASIGHHHATGHPGVGGDTDYRCDGCDFEIADSVVVHGGPVMVTDVAEPPPGSEDQA